MDYHLRHDTETSLSCKDESQTKPGLVKSLSELLVLEGNSEDIDTLIKQSISYDVGIRSADFLSVLH